jgi:beta-lactamase class A
MARPSDKSGRTALPGGVETRSVDGRALVGSSSTRPSPTSETPPEHVAIFEDVLDDLTEYATTALDDAGLPPLQVRVELSVEYLP